MTVTVKKVGEAAAKGAAKAAEKIVLRPPRAVTAAEAPNVQPARKSTDVSMMPWRGWFQRWLREQIGEEKFQRFRSAVFFMPDDVYDLEQAPRPNQKVPMSRTDPTVTHMYRHPSPGSQKPANIPQWEEGEDPFDSGYFKRDTRRRYDFSELGHADVEMTKLEMMDPDDPAVQEEKAKLEAGPTSSKGNKGVFATGPTNFDPTGLRATMSTTWAATLESLDSHMPNHLPTATWEGKEQEIIQWYEDRDLPVPVGAVYEGIKVPRERRMATW